MFRSYVVVYFSSTLFLNSLFRAFSKCFCELCTRFLPVAILILLYFFCEKAYLLTTMYEDDQLTQILFGENVVFFTVASLIL